MLHKGFIQRFPAFDQQTVKYLFSMMAHELLALFAITTILSLFLPLWVSRLFDFSEMKDSPQALVAFFLDKQVLALAVTCPTLSPAFQKMSHRRQGLCCLSKETLKVMAGEQSK